MRRAVFPLLALLLVAAAPPAAAQPDHVVTTGPDGAVTDDGGLGAPATVEPGENLTWTINLTADYTVVELRFSPAAWDVERPRQVVPTLRLDPSEPVCVENAASGFCEYILFRHVGRPEVWDVDAPARIANVSEADGEARLRVGIPGPVNATLTFARDVAPPAYEVGEASDITTIGFFVETMTDELALGDLQVKGPEDLDWIRNPTSEYHYIQRFPVQGLDADTLYDTRVIFTDWAGNTVTTDTFQVRTLPEPDRPIPDVIPLTPEPNATVRAGGLAIQARISSPESPVPADGVRLFFDLQEVHEGFAYANGLLTWVPREALEPGPHVVSVEARNVAGGLGRERWTFEIGDPERAESPGGGPALLVLGAVVAVALARRAR